MERRTLSARRGKYTLRDRNQLVVRRRLRTLRYSNALTQRDMAMKLNLYSRFRYWQIENEEVIATPDEQRRIAKILGVLPNEIFPADAKPSKSTAA